jgi:hypothetical protein
MDKYIPTFISLFGSISGITVAFLVLLFESAKNWKNNAKQHLISEISSCLKCAVLPTITDLKEGKEFYIELSDDVAHKIVDKERTEKLLVLLKTTEKSLLNKTIDGKSNEQAGIDTKYAKHIERYHSVDTDEAYVNYKNSEKFFTDFPKFAQLSVGIPLVITFLFVLVGYFYSGLTTIFQSWFVDSVIFLIVLIGLLFVYLNTTKSLSTLTKINQ